MGRILTAFALFAFATNSFAKGANGNLITIRADGTSQKHFSYGVPGNPGSPGSPGSMGSCGDGLDVTLNMSGGNGSDGTPGEDGGDGGDALVYFEDEANLKNIYLDNQGAPGGDGGT